MRWGFDSLAAWKIFIRMWIMDKKMVIKWLVPVVARGIAWFLAVKLGMEAVESEAVSTQIGDALGALALAGVSIYTSVSGRKKLLEAKPPK